MKRCLWAVYLLLLIPLSLFPLHAFGRVLETIDATVNGELILSGEVNARIKSKAAELKLFVPVNNGYALPDSAYQELRPKILEQMIDEILLIQAVRGKLSEENLTYIREDALSKTDYLMEQFRKGIDSADQLIQKENQQAMTWEEMRQATYQQMYNDNLRRVIANQIINRRVETPTQEELDNYENQFPENPPSGEITIQHIQLNLSPTATQDEEKQVFQKAQEIVLRARNGDQFDLLVSLFSQNEDSRKKNGILPPFKKGTFLPEFNSVFDLKVGDITDPIRTATAYHIVRVVFKDTLEARVLELKRREAVNTWITELKKEAKIDRRERKNPSPPPSE